MIGEESLRTERGCGCGECHVGVCVWLLTPRALCLGDGVVSGALFCAVLCCWRSCLVFSFLAACSFEGGVVGVAEAFGSGGAVASGVGAGGALGLALCGPGLGVYLAFLVVVGGAEASGVDGLGAVLVAAGGGVWAGLAVGGVVGAAEACCADAVGAAVDGAGVAPCLALAGVVLGAEAAGECGLEAEVLGAVGAGLCVEGAVCCLTFGSVDCVLEAFGAHEDRDGVVCCGSAWTEGTELGNAPPAVFQFGVEGGCVGGGVAAGAVAGSCVVGVVPSVGDGSGEVAVKVRVEVSCGVVGVRRWAGVALGDADGFVPEP